jgi:hypothetical protein
MKKLYFTVMCLIFLGMSIVFSGSQNTMSEQEDFIKDFLKNKQTSNRIDSDFVPDAINSGFPA